MQLDLVEIALVMLAVLAGVLVGGLWIGLALLACGFVAMAFVADVPVGSVLATTVSANARDYTAVVVEDCVDTMDRSLHESALNLIRQAFGWTATTREILEAL